MKFKSFENYIKEKNSKFVLEQREETLVNEFVGGLLKGIGSAIGGAVKGATAAAINNVAGQPQQQGSIQERIPMFMGKKTKKVNTPQLDPQTLAKVSAEVQKIDKKNVTFNDYKSLFPNEVNDIKRIQTKDVVGQAEEDQQLHDNVQGTNRFNQEQLAFLEKDKILKEKFKQIMKGNLLYAGNKKHINSAYIKNIIGGLKYDQGTHKYYLNRPADKNTGSHGWQNHWISVYDGWINKLNQVLNIFKNYKI
jgi:hypothetical protein